MVKICASLLADRLSEKVSIHFLEKVILNLISFTSIQNYYFFPNIDGYFNNAMLGENTSPHDRIRKYNQSHAEIILRI